MIKHSTFAYLADVYVLEEHRRKGLCKWMLETALALPELSGIRRFMLGTDDAHGLYAKFGFKPLAKPGNFMEISRKDFYLSRLQTS